jgi:DNA-directed RNA polymerase specialized sigma24 family protein
LDPFHSQRSAWKLDQASFDALLSSFHSDPEMASREYERLRRRLIRFFALHRVSRPEDLADVAFNRLARKIAQGESICNVSQYVAGIARILLLEDRAEARRETRVLRLHAAAANLPEPEPEALVCLEACLDEMSPDGRNLLLRYYSAESRTHIEVRQKIAEQMGLKMNALRNRALRLREQLEDCVLRRLGEKKMHDTFPRDLSKVERGES